MFSLSTYPLLCRLGPLTSSWCMRMEAKNSYFKRIAQLGNFKNIALSVARRHQKLMCAFINSEDFFDEAIIVPECKHNYIQISFVLNFLT